MRPDDQRIERVQEFVLRGSGARQEMDVVHGQSAKAAVPGAKAAQRAWRIASRKLFVNASAVIDRTFRLGCTCRKP